MFKKIIFISAVLLVSVAFTVFADTEVDETEREYVLIPVNISIFPTISSPLPLPYKTINYLELNIAAGYADVLRGAGIGVINVFGENVTGFNAGVVNVTGGNLAGLQAGVINVTVGETKGLPLGVVNYTKKSNHAQIGVVNVGIKAKGLQLGVVNIADENEGVPIGVVSVVRKGGQTHGQAWVDEMGFVNIAFIHGTQRVYNIYTTAIDVMFDNWAFGLGLGVHFKVNPVFINTEAVTSMVYDITGHFDQSGMLNRLRVYAGYDVAKNFTIIGGLSFNHFNVSKAGDPGIDTLHGYQFGFSGDKNHFWPGFFTEWYNEDC